MYFTETEIQTLNWRTDLVELSNKHGWVLNPSSDIEAWQWVPGNGITFRLVKHKDLGYFLLGPSPVDNTKQTMFRKFKLNKWGF
jgi:hypothetical protein